MPFPVTKDPDDTHQSWPLTFQKPPSVDLLSRFAAVSLRLWWQGRVKITSQVKVTTVIFSALDPQNSRREFIPLATFINAPAGKEVKR